MVFTSLLSSRSLLRVTGDAAHGFLQGLFTNDIRLLTPGKSIWGCFLNHNGRLLCDAYMYQPSVASNVEPVIFIEVHCSLVETLENHLLEMRMRKKIHVQNVGNELVVVATASSNNETDLHSDKKLSSVCSDYETFLDPRSFALPSPLYKTIIPAAKVPLAIDPEVFYTTYLYTAGIGEGPEIFKPQKSFPFEANTDMLRGVSFHKGCYLGQELTHRTHVMLVTRKRTVPLHFPLTRGKNDGELRTVVNGEALLIGGQKVGEVLATCGDVGLGLLRLRYVDGVTRKAPGLMLHDAVPVETRIPTWWQEKVIKKVLSV